MPQVTYGRMTSVITEILLTYNIFVSGVQHDDLKFVYIAK